ncbi:hypothetical protein T492DRAFT_1001442 [Pavlovales sp. CCMP2436]|nr:hypothetical protein T492DRAFT_1001442 [Pavlovales sp. CCMP2436]|mmetsp:Transcript_3789/g.9785  ORF Transcript_3789/g.9785 Transcript_3789/m.9785 type:complete len:256 (-) Transcript_3789:309-1076(-)
MRDDWAKFCPLDASGGLDLSKLNVAQIEELADKRLTRRASTAGLLTRAVVSDRKAARAPVAREFWVISYTATDIVDPTLGKRRWVISLFADSLPGFPASPFAGCVVGNLTMLYRPDTRAAIFAVRDAMCVPAGGAGPPRRPLTLLVAHRFGLENARLIKAALEPSLIQQVIFEPAADAAREATTYGTRPDGLNFEPTTKERSCAHCGALEASRKQMRLCRGCRKIAYCGSDCARLVWRAGHKLECECGANAQSRS